MESPVTMTADLRQMESYVKLAHARLRADNPMFAGGER